VLAGERFGGGGQNLVVISVDVVRALGLRLGRERIERKIADPAVGALAL
jgi:hypothetical protein